MLTQPRSTDSSEERISMPFTVAVLLLLVAVWLGVHIIHNATDALRALTGAAQQTSVSMTEPAR
jgi:hypothetical protein